MSYFQFCEASAWTLNQPWRCFSVRFLPKRIETRTRCVKPLCSPFGQTGLYRLSGSDRTIKELKEKFLRGKTVPMLSKVDDIHAIAGLLKDFLRSLKEPLLTFRLNRPFMEAAGTRVTASDTGACRVFSHSFLFSPTASHNELMFPFRGLRWRQQRRPDVPKHQWSAAAPQRHVGFLGPSSSKVRSRLANTQDFSVRAAHLRIRTSWNTIIAVGSAF